MNASTTSTRRRMLDWLDKRLPVRAFIESQLTEYYPPKNLNAWYYFGVMALVVLAVQILSGIFLAMHYKPGERPPSIRSSGWCAKCRGAG